MFFSLFLFRMWLERKDFVLRYWLDVFCKLLARCCACFPRSTQSFLVCCDLSELSHLSTQSVSLRVLQSCLFLFSGQIAASLGSAFLINSARTWLSNCMEEQGQEVGSHLYGWLWNAQMLAIVCAFLAEPFLFDSSSFSGNIISPAAPLDHFPPDPAQTPHLRLLLCLVAVICCCCCLWVWLFFEEDRFSSASAVSRSVIQPPPSVCLRHSFIFAFIKQPQCVERGSRKQRPPKQENDTARSPLEKWDLGVAFLTPFPCHSTRGRQRLLLMLSVLIDASSLSDRKSPVLHLQQQPEQQEVNDLLARGMEPEHAAAESTEPRADGRRKEGAGSGEEEADESWPHPLATQPEPSSLRSPRSPRVVHMLHSPSSRPVPCVSSGDRSSPSSSSSSSLSFSASLSLSSFPSFASTPYSSSLSSSSASMEANDPVATASFLSSSCASPAIIEPWKARTTGTTTTRAHRAGARDIGRDMQKRSRTGWIRQEDSRERIFRDSRSPSCIICLVQGTASYHLVLLLLLLAPFDFSFFFLLFFLCFHSASSSSFKLFFSSCSGSFSQLLFSSSKACSCSCPCLCSSYILFFLSFLRLHWRNILFKLFFTVVMTRQKMHKSFRLPIHHHIFSLFLLPLLNLLLKMCVFLPFRLSFHSPLLLHFLLRPPQWHLLYLLQLALLLFPRLFT